MTKIGDRLSEAEQSLRDRLLGPLVLSLFPQWVKPNHLTALRAVLVGLAVAMYLARLSLLLQLLVLIVAALTDTFDGILARSRGQFSRLGAYYDHGVDWLLGGWSGVLALINGLLPLSFIILIVTPQFGIFIVDRIRAAALPEEERKRKILAVTMGAANFQPSAFSRFVFFTLLTGFFLLLLHKAAPSAALGRAGPFFLYLGAALSWIQLVDTTVRMISEKRITG